MRKDKEGIDNGKVSIDIPDNNVVVGRRYGVKITYTAGPKGVSVGGSLRFRLPGFKVDELKYYPRRRPIECSNPKAKLRASNEVPIINGKDGREEFTQEYLFLTVEGRPLLEGDTVSVYYGNPYWLPKYVTAPTLARKWKVEVATDLDGERNAPGSGYYLVRSPQIINFVSDRAVKLETTITSTTKVGEPFEVTVRARDRYNNLATSYRGRIRLNYVGGILESYRFKPEDQGVHTFKGAVFETPGINRIVAIDEGYGLYGRSNPSKTTTRSPKYMLYWGDTHVHSYISVDSAAVGVTATPEEDYAYARNVADLDFCMVTDHNGPYMSKADWRETRNAARNWYEPGRFVTFSGFECTHREFRKDGDRNIYYFTDKAPLINEGTTEDVFKNLKGKRVMVIPHQHGRTNWNLHDPELERVTEIYSHWGCSLSPDTEPRMILSRLRPENYVHYALDKCIKIGFIGSSDHCFGHPGDDFWWPLGGFVITSCRGGLAAVYSSSLTREGIWEALWNRRCYATTRARILLEFEINGHIMGEEFTLPSREDRNISVSTSGTTSIEKVEIIKNGSVMNTRMGGEALDMKFICIDKEAERLMDYYYIQVTQVDGERAWSSPIWVTQK